MFSRDRGIRINNRFLYFIFYYNYLLLVVLFVEVRNYFLIFFNIYFFSDLEKIHSNVPPSINFVIFRFVVCYLRLYPPRLDLSSFSSRFVDYLVSCCVYSNFFLFAIISILYDVLRQQSSTLFVVVVVVVIVVVNNNFVVSYLHFHSMIIIVFESTNNKYLKVKV